MKVSARSLSVVALIAGSTFFGTPVVLAQQKGGSLKEQLVGTWTVVSQYVDQQGKKVEPFGSSPKGMFVFDRGGHASIIIMRSGLSKIASNNRMKATPDEHKAIVEGTLAYYGIYTVNEKDESVTIKIEGSTYPNWDGETQKRMIAIKGDELRVINPTPNIGGGTAYVVLKRAR